MKEAKRRREWGAGKDPLKLAAMPWPVFPRNAVANVLGSLLDEVMRIDKEHLGIFSVPVPRNQFPEYYELIKKPMDYGMSCLFDLHLSSVFSAWLTLPSLVRYHERKAYERRVSLCASHAERLCSGEYKLPSVQCAGL